LRVRLTRDHLSVISGITPTGKLYLQQQDHPFKSVDVVVFLQHLLAQIAGKLLVVWDGAPIHRSRLIKDFLASESGHRLRLEQLPGYAPDLNPDEGIWNRLKQVELKNLCCATVQELRRQLRLAVGRLRRKPQIIQGCIRQATCYV